MTEKDKIRWKERINLYHLIQQKCDRPAYFWHSFRVYGNKSIEELIKQGGGFLLPFWINYGGLNPQKWCDTN